MRRRRTSGHGWSFKSPHEGKYRPASGPLFAKGIASYLIFLAENTGLVPAERCAAARALLDRYQSYDSLLDDISR